jgi:16S rRNA C1402 N4-methylase RsmH
MYRLVTKKAIKPNYKEVAVNRASRSAKLRILEKINE